MELSRINNSKGFSLIELMVVMAIVGILMGMAIPSISGFVSQLEITEAAQTVSGALKQARELAVSKNIRTVVWIRDDDTTTGRVYEIYRQATSGETLPGASETVASVPDCYLVETGNISQKNNIVMYTKATASPDGGSTNVQTSIQIRFTPSGTAGFVTVGTLYLMPEKEFIQNKREKMRAITVSAATGRIRIYTWNKGATSWE